MAASTFAGCGGSSLGLKWAGLDVRYASEFFPNAAECYELNFGLAPDRRDVRIVRGAEILEACRVKELDLLDGSPPCQSFSMAGKRQKAWGKKVKHSDGTEQRSDDLFLEFCRLVEEIKPRAFMAENVAGLAAGVAWGFLRRVSQRLQAAGYHVACRILDASWLGVPQARRRLWIVGVRAGLGLVPEMPAPFPRRAVMADVLPHLARQDYSSNAFERRQRVAAAPSAVITAAPRIAMIVDPRGQHRVQQRSSGQPSVTIKGGRSSHHIRVYSPPAPPLGRSTAAKLREVQPGRHHAKHFNLGRPDPRKACPTIAAMWGNKGVHKLVAPDGTRALEIWEVKRLMGFPDDFELVGSYQQQWARLGNAVPPPMARAVARALAGVLARA